MPMKARYTVVNGEVIAQKRDGVRSELVPDMLGSTVAIVNMVQEKTDTFAYCPYGKVASRTGTTVTPFQFVGTLGYYQDAPDRSYVRARYLDSNAGRWITQYPIGFWGGPNLYKYCNATPSSLSDPSGLTVTITYDRTTGTLTIVDDSNPKNKLVVQDNFGSKNKLESQAVFSGTGPGMNNPAMENNKDVGPIPAGCYLIGKEDDTGHMGKHFPLLTAQNDWRYFHPADYGLLLLGQTDSTRDAFNLHAGRVSDGCITIYSTLDKTNSAYPFSKTWGEILQFIRNSGPMANYDYVNGNLIKSKPNTIPASPFNTNTVPTGPFNGVVIVK